MSQRLPVDGVALVVEGTNKFIAQLNQVDAAWGKTVSGFDKGAQVTEKVNQGFDKTTDGAGAMGAGLLAAAGSIGAVVAGLGILVAGVGKVVGVLKEAGSELMKFVDIAGRFQEMEFTALAIGRAMGLTEDAIRGAVSEIEDLGIRSDVANKTVGQFARNQLDLAKATDLVRIAQATGIILNEDSSASMESLTRAITTGSTVMLRRMGIMVDNAQIERKLAAELGVTTDQLSQQQKMMARTNAIIEQGANLLDVYDAAMESPTKRLRSLTGRLLPQLQAALGAPFLNAWSTVIDAVSKFVVALTDAVSEGGALFPILVNLGAAASILADGFASALNMITNMITGLSEDITMGIGETIEDAFRWGVEIVAAFAEGIVSATTGVLTQAMQFVGDMLSSWLLGASPPKVAPGIVSWGIGLMQQFLGGMTKADFGILKEIQGPLKKILEGPEFANVSKVLAGALAGDDRGAFLEATGRAAGVFGDAVRKLAELNFELADSIEDVQAAEAALAASREQVTDSQAEVNRLTRQYNELLREGADRQTLQAQLGLINAAEQNLHTAMDQVNVQEQAIKTAKERQKQLKDETGLQKSVVDQLLGVNDALKQTDKERERAARKATTRKTRGLPPELVPPVPTGFDITSRIGEAIDAAKAAMKEKFKDIFKPLSDAWKGIGKDVSNLGNTWDKFVIIVGGAWDRLKEKYPTLQKVENWAKGLPKQLETVRDWFRDKLPPAVEKLTGVLWKDENSLLSGWKKLLAFLKDDFWPWVRDTLWVKLTEFADLVITPLEKGIAAVVQSFQDWYDLIVKLGSAYIDDMLEGIRWFVDLVSAQSPSPMAKGLKEVNQQLQILSSQRLPGLGQTSPSMQGALASSMPMMGSMSAPNITVNAGGNTINSGMDEAAFDARVQRSLRRVLR